MKSIIIGFLLAFAILLPLCGNSQKDIDVIQILEKNYIAFIDTLPNEDIVVTYRHAKMVEKDIERQIQLYEEEINSLDFEIAVMMKRRDTIFELIGKLENKKSGK